MYYVVNDETGMIIEASAECPDPQESADFFKCPVYIIDGEHSGLSAEPSAPTDAQRIAGLEAQITELKNRIERGNIL